jgi:hypothetical protein
MLQHWNRIIPDETKCAHAYGLQVGVPVLWLIGRKLTCGVCPAPACDLECRAEDLGTHEFSHDGRYMQTECDGRVWEDSWVCCGGCGSVAARAGFGPRSSRRRLGHRIGSVY